MRGRKVVAFAVLFVTLPLLSLVNTTSTFADESTFSITTDEVLQLEVPDTANITLNPISSAAVFGTTNVTATVSTNSALGYTLTMTPTNSQGTTDLIGTSTNMPTLATSSEGYTESSFTANSWGYRLSSGNYFGVPATLSPSEWDTSGPTNSTDHIITLAAKVDGEHPAGDYATTLNFEVVAKRSELDWEDIVPNCTAHPEKCDSVTNKVAIQSIDEEVCNAVEVYDSQYQVTDTRDHKNYWISKLRDGNCWMTQNLDLDLDSSVALTSATTDLGWNGSSYDTASWTPNKTTYHFETGAGDLMNSGNAAYSFDPGDYYQQGTYFAPQICNYLTDESSTCISATMDPVNGTHGHVGNYYTWAAAVATNSPNAINSGKVEDSICPKNWRLPIVDSTVSDYTNINNLYNSSNNSDQGLIESPIYFIRGGYIMSGTSITAPGPLSYYWSGVSSNNGVAYLYTYNGGGSPDTASTNFGKNGEIFARCIARKTDYYSISFDANGGTGTMSTQQIPSGSSANLSANAFTHEGYYFNGWNTKADGSGTGYGDKSPYKVEKNKTNTITLYAQWTTTPPICTEDCDGSNPKYESGITIQRAYELAYTEHHLGMYEEQHEGQGDYARVNSWPPESEPYKGYDVRYAMQDIYLTYRGTKICNLVTVIGDEYQALDIRDNKLYWIAKLSDGTCWMTQNLDLDLIHVANDNDALYTHDNTDIGWGTDTSVNKWNPLRSTIPRTDIPSSGRLSVWCNDFYTPCSIDTGDWYWTDKWYEFKNTSYNYLTGNQGDKFFQAPTGSGMHGHVGNHYNWSAAVALNSTSSYTSSTYNNTANNPQNSICPAGWRLPIITSYTEGQLGANDFYNLAYKYGGISTDQYYSSNPLWFVRGGQINVNELGDAGEWGWYASSTVRDSGGNYAMDTVSNYINTTGSNATSNGLSIRCLSR